MPATHCHSVAINAILAVAGGAECNHEPVLRALDGFNKRPRGAATKQTTTIGLHRDAGILRDDDYIDRADWTKSLIIALTLAALVLAGVLGMLIDLQIDCKRKAPNVADNPKTIDPMATTASRLQTI